MSLQPRWTPGATEQLKWIGWHPAEYVDAAVLRFAATGRGDIEHLAGHVYVLRVGAYRVWFEIEDETMHILRVYGPQRRSP
jgi:hypothetical protein